MKFYQKIIGISKDAPNPELTMTFSSNGFEFDNNLFLNDGITLSLNGNNDRAILFRNSGTAIADLDNALHFGGSGRGIYFNLDSGTIWSSNIDWSWGSSSKPLNNIYSTNSHFNNIPSCTITANTNTVNIKGLNFTSTNPVILPENSRIRVFSSTEMHIAGAEILTITPGDSRYQNSDGSWFNTHESATWWSIRTTGSGQECVQFFLPFYLYGEFYGVLLPVPFTDYSTLEDYFVQLSYTNYRSDNTDIPTIELVVVDGENFVKVTQTQSKTELFIQITRFKNIS